MATKESDGTAIRARRKVALVIGIGTYDHIEGLKNPENDANDMSDALESIGFAVTKKLNIKRADMKYAVFDFEEVIEPGDMALFYFAGHGTQWEVSIYSKLYKLTTTNLFVTFLGSKLFNTKRYSYMDRSGFKQKCHQCTRHSQ